MVVAERDMSKDVVQVGERFLRALTERDSSALAACFDAGMTFRALVPRGLLDADGATETAQYFQRWFWSADRLDVLDTRIDLLADRQYLAWRFRVHDSSGTQVIEQHAFATIDTDRFVAFHLLCSGFCQESQAERDPEAEGDEAISDIAAVLHGGDANCATLTPLIRARLRELNSGQVLEVVTDEPSAERDIISWTNLTGHRLIASRRDGVDQHFYIRRK
jgi:tRNA 2-thiouridine synthesizing protein A